MSKLLKNHEIRYILQRAQGARTHPKAHTEDNTYLFKTYPGRIEVLIGGANIFSEKRAEQKGKFYEGIPPTVTVTDDMADWKKVFWRCGLPESV